MNGFWRTRSGRRSNSSVARSGSRCGRGIKNERSECRCLSVVPAKGLNAKGAKEEREGRHGCCRRSAVFAVEHVADDLAALGVGFGLGLALKAFGGGARCCFGFSLGCAALGAAVGVAGFVRTQFELLSAEDAGFDREGHGYILNRKAAGVEMITPAVGCGTR